MKFYLGDRLLFIDMNHQYTHCVVEGEDRVICCQKSLSEAQNVCRDIKDQKLKRVENMQRLLNGGHEYTGAGTTMFGTDLKDLYPTAGLLHGAMLRIRKNAESVRVEALTVVP